MYIRKAVPNIRRSTDSARTYDIHMRRSSVRRYQNSRTKTHILVFQTLYSEYYFMQLLYIAQRAS